MQRFRRVLAAAILGASAILGGATGALAAPAGDVVGHVYVNNNTAGRNTIAGFDRHADGSLTPIAGTPFDAGGAGTGSPTGSAGALQLSSDGRYLLAVDAASNQISVLQIRHDGSLDLVNASPARTAPRRSASPSTATWCTSRTPAPAAATTRASGSTAAATSADRRLDLRPAGQRAARPRAVQRDGRHLVGTRVGPDAGPSFIDSFSVGSDGRLTPAPGSPFPAQRIGPFGSAFRPTDPRQLYVSNAHDGPGPAACPPTTSPPTRP